MKSLLLQYLLEQAFQFSDTYVRQNLMWDKNLLKFLVSDRNRADDQQL